MADVDAKVPFQNHKTLVTYIRDENGNPEGVIVALDSQSFGWAFRHKNDHFRKDKGRMIAFNRAAQKIVSNVPYRFQVEFNNRLERFKARAVKYYKQDQ